jgi:hypothetical protein
MWSAAMAVRPQLDCLRPISHCLRSCFLIRFRNAAQTGAVRRLRTQPENGGTDYGLLQHVWNPDS